MNTRVTFEEVFEQNEGIRNYHRNKMLLHNPEFYLSGFDTAWHSCRLDNGILSTYFDFAIRKRLNGVSSDHAGKIESDGIINPAEVRKLDIDLDGGIDPFCSGGDSVEAG